MTHLLLVAASLLLSQVSANFWAETHASEEGNQILSESFIYEDSLQYTFFYQTVSWEEATVICQYYKSHLAAVDDVSKAAFLANAIADSNILFEDIWIGGRYRKGMWFWHETGDVIPNLPDEFNYPPWVRTPNRQNKECISMDRRGHDIPLFLDVDCRLRKPFICEKGISVKSDKPLASKWVKINGRLFVLYHGRISWMEAMAFCWQQGLRLAVVPTNDVARKLAEAMTHTRPDLENVWIGATNQFGKWEWPANGRHLPRPADADGYPPWMKRSGKHTSRGRNCLVLDRHLCENATFIETSCDRTRDFACEEFTPADSAVVQENEIGFENSGRRMFLVNDDMSWWDASRTCESRGSKLLEVDSKEIMDAVLTAMVDNPRELKHVWLGGRVQNEKWVWTATGRTIPDGGLSSFPPWCDKDTDPGSDCLNLDRQQHTVPMFYGLPCHSKQPFVCEVDCSSPGVVMEGQWKCQSSSPTMENSCTLTCNEGHEIMGSPSMKCSQAEGWSGDDHTSMLPRCQRMCDVNIDLLKVISHYESNTGFLFVMDAARDIADFLSAALQFVSAVIRAFPLSDYRKAGLISCNSPSSVVIPFNQEDSCSMLQTIYDLNLKHSNGIGFETTVEYVKDQIATLKKGSRSIIFFLSTVDHNTEQNQVLLAPLKKAGNAVFTLDVGVASRYDVTPLASIGPLLRLNHYTFKNPLKLTEVALYMTGDHFDNVEHCTAPPLVRGIDALDFNLPRWLIFRVTNKTMKDIRARQERKKT